VSNTLSLIKRFVNEGKTPLHDRNNRRVDTRFLSRDPAWAAVVDAASGLLGRQPDGPVTLG